MKEHTIIGQDGDELYVTTAEYNHVGSLFLAVGADSTYLLEPQVRELVSVLRHWLEEKEKRHEAT